MSNEIQPHAAWKPYMVDAVNQTTPGFIGRAVAVLIDGIEAVIVTRDMDDLAAAFGTIAGQPLDESRVYKATLLQSATLEVDLDAKVGEMTGDNLVLAHFEGNVPDPDEPTSQGTLELDVEKFMEPEKGVVKKSDDGADRPDDDDEL